MRHRLSTREQLTEHAKANAVFWAVVFGFPLLLNLLATKAAPLFRLFSEAAIVGWYAVFLAVTHVWLGVPIVAVFFAARAIRHIDDEAEK